MSETASGQGEPFRLHFRVDAGSATDFEQWRYGMSPMFALDAAESAERAQYHFNGIAHQFAGFSVSFATSSPTTFDRGGQVIARSALDQINVITYLAGGCVLTVDGRAREVNAGDVLLLDMTQPSRLVTTAYQNLSFMVERTEIECLMPNVEDLHGLVLPQGTPLNTLLLSHMRALYSEVPSLGNFDAQAAVRATAGVIAACAAIPERRATQRADAALAISRLRRLVDANLNNPELDPEFLIEQGGVSRATLYRLFQPTGGVRTYIRQRRLTRAFRLLASPAHRSERIGGIAARCGFENDAVFSRAMRRAYGISPSDIRAGAWDDRRRPQGDLGSPFRELNHRLVTLGGEMVQAS